jgi:mRNA interferase HicA
MNGNEFLRKLKRLARRKGLRFSFDASAGKGGHGEVAFGERSTVLRGGRQKEIPIAALRAMLRQLGIDPKDLR